MAFCLLLSTPHDLRLDRSGDLHECERNLHRMEDGCGMQMRMKGAQSVLILCVCEKIGDRVESCLILISRLLPAIILTNDDRAEQTQCGPD